MAMATVLTGISIIMLDGAVIVLAMRLYHQHRLIHEFIRRQSRVNRLSRILIQMLEDDVRTVQGGPWQERLRRATRTETH